MTLQKLTVTNFTVFQNMEISFGSAMNVVVGANGAGKSHLLKLAYAASAASYQAKQESKTSQDAFTSLLEEKIMDVFRADQLENLVFGRTYPTKARVNVAYAADENMDLTFEIEYPSKGGVQTTGEEPDFEGVEELDDQSDQIYEDEQNDQQEQSDTETVKLKVSKFPQRFVDLGPIFIPTREILSIIPAFSKFHREKALLLDGTYFDLSFFAQMARTSSVHPEIENIISSLRNILQGDVVQEAGKFFVVNNELKLEMPLVAEGLRKIAMLCCLLENSAIQPKTMLLWDEPEANLNPALMVELANILVKLSALGIQVILATHSLFLLREIHICLTKTNEKGRYFALDKVNGDIHLSQSDSIEEIEPIAALDADLSQSDRYLELEI